MINLISSSWKQGRNRSWNSSEGNCFIRSDIMSWTTLARPWLNKGSFSVELERSTAFKPASSFNSAKAFGPIAAWVKGLITPTVSSTRFSKCRWIIARVRCASGPVNIACAIWSTVRISSVIIRQNDSDTSSWRCKNKPWTFNPSIFIGLTGLKIIFNATQLVAQPTKNPHTGKISG